MSLKLDLPSELEQKLHREAQIAGVGESEYALRVIADRLTHGSAMLSEDEEVLLREIDRGFSDPWWERYGELVGKREDESLSDFERREFCACSRKRWRNTMSAESPALPGWPSDTASPLKN